MTPNTLLNASPAERDTISIPATPVFPRRGDQKPRILLCSVFGPYAQDDDFGSRSINPMELWHNQVTRVQGPFSLRMFHRSWGQMLIQANVQAPCTMLDFPSRERFIEELKSHRYDIIGMGAIIPNFKKVREMCRLIREHQPHARIIIGGHIANMPGLADRVEVDHVVPGDGVRWMREYLGEDPDAPIRHPEIWSGINRRSFGVNLPFNPANSAAALIPSVGCPVGCNFCATSAMFGGKGHCVDFFQSAEELFAIMCQLEERMQTRSFFVMDENFLLRKPRAIKLLELMEQHDKSWALYVFSSANAIHQYTFEQLAGLGVSWLWMGLEGKDSRYNKLRDTDTYKLIRDLQDHGIRVLGSSIVGLEEHTPENIDAAIDYAVGHETDFHQFMLYTPIPGTPLHAQHSADGSLLGEDGPAEEDIHGQDRFNFRHANIPAGAETEMLLRAFHRDFERNGPSTVRIVATALKGWKRYRNHPNARIRRRYEMEAEGMWNIFAGTVWATRKWFADNPTVREKMDALLKNIYREHGLKARLAAPLLGRFFHHMLTREQKRLDNGQTYEPPTFYEHNAAAATLIGDADAPQVKTVPGLAETTAVEK